MEESVRVELARLSLPQPLERLIYLALSADNPDRRHECLLTAWEAASRMLACTLVAVVWHQKLGSTDLDLALQALARPSSFGSWVTALQKAADRLRTMPTPPSVVSGLLAGLDRPWGSEPALKKLGAYLKEVPWEGEAPQLRKTALDLLVVMTRYRNQMQSTHHTTRQDLREKGNEPILHGLLAFCAGAWPANRSFSIVVVHRKDHVEAGYRVACVNMEGSWPILLPEVHAHKEQWEEIKRGRSYLLVRPDEFIPLYPVVAATKSTTTLWALGWLAGGSGHLLRTIWYDTYAGGFEISLPPEAPDVFRKQKDARPLSSDHAEPRRRSLFTALRPRAALTASGLVVLVAATVAIATRSRGTADPPRSAPTEPTRTRLAPSWSRSSPVEDGASRAPSEFSPHNGPLHSRTTEREGFDAGLPPAVATHRPSLQFIHTAHALQRALAARDAAATLAAGGVTVFHTVGATPPPDDNSSSPSFTGSSLTPREEEHYPPDDFERPIPNPYRDARPE